MLEKLTLRHFVFAKYLEVNFTEGFCVLTGDSGAGKSLLVNSLSTLLGEKCPPSLLPKDGHAEVEASLYLPPDSVSAMWLADNNLSDADNNQLLILRRVLGGSGKRSAAYINGRQVPLAQLVELSAMTIEICGQQSHHSLRQTSAQRSILDRTTEADDKQVAQDFRHYQQCLAEWQAASAQQTQAAARYQLLSATLQEFEELGFSPEKWTQMNQSLKQITHAADLLQGCQQALHHLDGEGHGVQPLLSLVKNELESLARCDANFSNAIKVLEDIMILTNDLTSEITHYVESAHFNFEAKEEIENFVARCYHLARKHGLADASQCGDYIKELQAEIDSLPTADSIEQQRLALEKSQEVLNQSCTRLTQQRKKAATVLGDSVNKLLGQLAMAKARFMVALEPLSAPTASGQEQVHFKISTRASGAMGDMAEVASGGELSRLGLAIALSSGKAEGVQASVFDEVDSGVSGAIAGEIGRLLKMLGSNRQVICVTHLPQVAAYADGHWLVVAGEELTVRSLSAEQRVEEIARLNSGNRITDSARDHAREMLQDASF